MKVQQRKCSGKRWSYLSGWKAFPTLIRTWWWSFLIYTVRNHTSENSFTPMQPSLNLPFHFLMKNLLMSDATLEAVALFLIWLRSLACVAVLCGGGEKKEHDVTVKSVVCFKTKSEINILSISRLKCLQGGIKQREDSLIRTPSSSHQFRCVKIWTSSFQNDTHSDKNAF